ncbi:MAG: LysR family transcriptional regulator [Pseudomonadota bacterium]
MTEFSNIELRRLDLTLLLVFLGLLRRRKARLVAEDLGLTQSAISQALGRLRDIFGDELFLRRPHGVEPTAIALALEAPVASAVEALRTALRETRTFNPEEAKGLVRLAALDAEQAALLPPLAAQLRRKAPSLFMSVLALGRSDAVQALEDGRVDMAVGFLPDATDPIHGERLYEESFLVAGMPDVLPDAPAISLDAYCRAEHILVSPRGDVSGMVDQRLEDLGRFRTVTLALPAFLPALAAAAQTGALVTMPARIVASFASAFGLRPVKPPLALPTFEISVYWHRRNERDPQNQWLRGQVKDLFVADGGTAGTTVRN